ncbi:MAG: tetratricopeptide repeat protein [Pseudomonadota bacterium]
MKRRPGRGQPTANRGDAIDAAAQNILMQAVAAHQSGKIQRAEQGYLHFLQKYPNNVDALHLLAIVALETNRAARGVALLEKAVTIHPNAAEMHGNLGNGQRRLKRHEDALRSFDRAIALQPKFVDAHYNRGLVLMDLGRTAEAAESYKAALALQPDLVEAHNNLGNALIDLDRPEAALSCFDQAIKLRPGNPHHHNNRGKALDKSGRTEDAIAAFQKAIEIQPNHAEAHGNLGDALRRLGRIEAALSSFDRAVKTDPKKAQTYYNRGVAFYECGRFTDALADFDKAISLSNDLVAAHHNRASTLVELGRLDAALDAYDTVLSADANHFDAHIGRGGVLLDLERPGEALSSYDAAVALRPDHAKAHCNRGEVLKELDRPDDAMASFNTALDLDLDLVDAHWNNSLCQLLLGQFHEGWRGYEYRKRRSEPVGLRRYDCPLWLGEEDLRGKTVFVYWEQGFGDTIQFCRYVMLLRERGARVTLSVQSPIRELITTHDPEIDIIGGEDEPDHFDFHIPLMSLPLAFGTDRDTIPCQTPYLAAETDRVASWKHRLGDDGFKIGICWQGKKTDVDRGRSFPVAVLSPIAARADTRLISLQKGDGIEQLADLPDGMAIETLGDDFDAGPDSFLDSAAVIRNLDLVITSDTAIAHLAGALGHPTWLALKHVPEWRWGRRGETTPWYPQTRLFRQTHLGDWSSVFDEMATQIDHRMTLAP